MEELLEDGRYDQLYRSWFVQELSESEVSAPAEASPEGEPRLRRRPYSRYPVGAAVLTSSGRIYTGSAAT